MSVIFGVESSPLRQCKRTELVLLRRWRHQWYQGAPRLLPVPGRAVWKLLRLTWRSVLRHGYENMSTQDEIDFLNGEMSMAFQDEWKWLAGCQSKHPTRGHLTCREERSSKRPCWVCGTRRSPMRALFLTSCGTAQAVRYIRKMASSRLYEIQKEEEKEKSSRLLSGIDVRGQSGRAMYVLRIIRREYFGEFFEANESGGPEWGILL